MRSASPPRCARSFSTITLVWADAGYTGRFVRDARKIWDLAVAIVKRPDQAKGFVLLHRRWAVSGWGQFWVLVQSAKLV